MKATAIKEVLRRAIREPTKMPAIYIWGGPGIGKSSICKQVTEEEGVGFIDIRMLLLDVTDLRGLIYPKDDKAIWLRPSILPTEGRHLILLDELNCAPPMQQNTALQLVLDRCVGDHKLPDTVAIAAAGNREMEAFVHRMSPALSNRFIHIDLEVDIEEWVKWAVQHNIDPIILSFLYKFKPMLLYQFDGQKKAWPSPRTWEFVSRVMNNGFSSYDDKFEIIKGAIGEGAAIELKTYTDIWKQLPDLEKILAGDDIIPDSVDLKYACCVGLQSKATTAAHYDRLLLYALKMPREYTMFLAKMLYQKNKILTCKAPTWHILAQTVSAIEKLLI